MYHKSARKVYSAPFYICKHPLCIGSKGVAPLMAVPYQFASLKYVSSPQETMFPHYCPSRQEAPCEPKISENLGHRVAHLKQILHQQRAPCDIYREPLLHLHIYRHHLFATPTKGLFHSCKSPLLNLPSPLLHLQNHLLHQQDHLSFKKPFLVLPQLSAPFYICRQLLRPQKAPSPLYQQEAPFYLAQSALPHLQTPFFVNNKALLLMQKTFFL